MSGTGSLVKIGGGVIDLTGANTYTGPTTVSNGTLNVAGSLTSATTVRNGASLGGYGTITGNVTADPGATVSPGASVGSLTINGAASFSSSTLVFELANLTALRMGKPMRNVATCLSSSVLAETEASLARVAPAGSIE